jgi:hypothetical protein
VSILDVSAAHEGGVLSWLIGGEMRHQATVTMGGGIPIDHEHASAGSGPGEHLAGSAFGVDVAPQSLTVAAASATASVSLIRSR